MKPTREHNVNVNLRILEVGGICTTNPDPKVSDFAADFIATSD